MQRKRGDEGAGPPAHAAAWLELPAGSRQAWLGMLRTHARLTSALDVDLQRRHGLSLSDFDVLLTLAVAPGRRRRMAELADAVLLSRSGLTRLVDRLENRGLLVRSRPPADVRQVYAEITDAGCDLLDQAAPAHVAGIRAQFLDRLTPADVDALAAIWRRLD